MKPILTFVAAAVIVSKRRPVVLGDDDSGTPAPPPPSAQRAVMESPFVRLRDAARDCALEAGLDPTKVVGITLSISDLASSTIAAFGRQGDGRIIRSEARPGEQRSRQRDRISLAFFPIPEPVDHDQNDLFSRDLHVMKWFERMTKRRVNVVGQSCTQWGTEFATWGSHHVTWRALFPASEPPDSRAIRPKS